MNRLVIKPRTPAVAVAISIVAGPPSTDSDGYEAIPEVIVVMDEVIVIMAMQVVAVPIAVPSSAACIPPRTAVPGTCGNVWPAHRTTKTATADVSTCEVGTASEVPHAPRGDHHPCHRRSGLRLRNLRHRVQPPLARWRRGQEAVRPQGRPRQEPCAFS